MSEDEKGVMTCAVEYKMPKGLNLDNIDNCYPQWQRFKQSFKTFIMAAGFEKLSEIRKAAILLNCIGQQAQELYFNVLKNDEKAKLEEVLDVFENYFKPKQNEVINTYNFNKRVQEEGESFDTFYTAIRKMAENCNFGDLKERMIRDRIVIGVKEQRMQQKLLEVKDLTMNKAVDICRSAELSREHLKTLANPEGVGEFKSPLQLRIQPGVQPVVRPPRRVPKALMKRLADKLEALVKHKVIARVEHPKSFTVRRIWGVIKTQLCTIALSLTLFNSVRLPREALRYGEVPYLMVYSFWLLVIGLPTTLLQLAMGQLSQQDTVGVWRAVPILRGVGHLKLLTSFVCCIYNMLYVGLAAVYIIWIAKGSFPLRECAKLHITPYGYENKMNASECFNSTFLAPFTEQPQYLGIMAVLIFILWFFVPIMLLHLRKSLKVSLVILLPIGVAIVAVLCTFLAESSTMSFLLESCEHWSPLTQPYIWHSALIQALLSNQIVGGYLISAGGSVYRQSDVRWTSTFIVMTNLLAGWLWVFFWQSIGGSSDKDKSFLAILIQIYQSSAIERRTKEWPLLALTLVFLSGVVTVLTLLFPIYDKFHRLSSFHWRLFASASSAVGTAFSVAVLAHGMGVAAMVDELVIPVLAAFTTTLEIVGFVFIYGWFYLSVDIQFITGSRLPCLCMVCLWSAPVFLLGVSGWWLRSLLRATWGQGQTLWPLIGAFIAIIVIMVIMAAIAVAKEEQFNLVTKIASAFRPSRLWGPEEPMARYMWMSQRFNNEKFINEDELSSEANDYPYIISDNSPKNNEIKYTEDWLQYGDVYQRTPKSYIKSNLAEDDDHRFQHTETPYQNASIPRSKKKKKTEEKFRSPNICIAKDELGGPLNCNCNRHFTLNVPDLRSNETATSL